MSAAGAAAADSALSATGAGNATVQDALANLVKLLGGLALVNGGAVVPAEVIKAREAKEEAARIRQLQREYFLSQGNDLLMWAARYEGPAEVKALLEMEYDRLAANNTGETAAHAAVRNTQHPALVELFKGSPALNALNKDGDTPLMLAFRLNRPLDTVRALVNAGANLEIANQEGIKPLKMATKLGRFGSVEILMQAKADPSCLCTAEHLLDQRIKAQDKQKLVHFVNAAQPAAAINSYIISRAVVQGTVANDFSFVGTLLDMKCDINQQNAYLHGHTLFTWAVHRRLGKLPSILTARGVDIYGKNKDEKTALCLSLNSAAWTNWLFDTAKAKMSKFPSAPILTADKKVRTKVRADELTFEDRMYIWFYAGEKWADGLAPNDAVEVWDQRKRKWERGQFMRKCHKYSSNDPTKFIIRKPDGWSYVEALLEHVRPADWKDKFPAVSDDPAAALPLLHPLRVCSGLEKILP